MEFFICLIVLMSIIVGFACVILLMGKFVVKGDRAIEMFALLNETSTREELDEIEDMANQALEVYRKLGYIALSVHDMGVYKQQLDNICYEIKQMRIKKIQEK